MTRDLISKTLVSFCQKCTVRVSNSNAICPLAAYATRALTYARISFRSGDARLWRGTWDGPHGANDQRRQRAPRIARCHEPVRVFRSRLSGLCSVANVLQSDQG